MKWQIQLLADPKTRVGEVDIYDVVGDPWMGTDAYNVLWKMRSMDVDSLVVRINSVGGVVSAGMDIHNIIKEHPAKKKIARISGCCASIATVIALAADEVEMHANSQWMVHEARASFDGFGTPPMLVEDLERMASLLAKTNTQMLAIYAAKTGKSTAKLAEVCAAETWFTAEEAKEFGFVDRVIEPGDEDSMLLAARAWTPNVSGQFKKFPEALANLAMVAQGKRPVVAAPAALESEEETMRRKIKAAASEAQKKLEALTKEFGEISAAADSALESSAEPQVVATATTEAKSKDVEKMEKELKALSKRAKDAEKELESLSSTAEEYAATKERCEKAEAELSDLKKKLEEARAEGDDADDDEDDEKDPEAKAFFSTLTVAKMRNIVRACVGATGFKFAKGATAEALELAVMKLTRGVTAVVNERDVRVALVDKLIADKRLMPHQRAWAIKTSKENLEEFIADAGGKPVVASEAKQDAQVAAKVQGVVTTGEVTLTVEERKLCAQSGVSEERWLEEKRKTAVATVTN